MSKYILNPDSLQIGDVICTREDAPISHAIRKVLSCEYSHVLIYVSYSSCVHANGDGVHSINTQRMIFNDPTDVAVLRHKLSTKMTEGELEKICIYPRSKVGTEYSVSDAIKAGISAKSKPPQKVDSNYQYCSRLVAESFGYAGIEISPEPSLCTPADIQRHPDFGFIEGAVRIANQQELEFAADTKKNTISKQTKIMNKIIHGSQRILGKNVQTFEDIFREVIVNPKHDEQIEALIHESGYLTIWADDVVKCPYRYFKTNYSDIRIIKSLNSDGLRLELSFANKDVKRFDNERTKLFNLHDRFPRKVFEQHISLYQTLLSLALQRQELFKWLLEINDAPDG